MDLTRRRVLVTAATRVAGTARAADATQPHPHQGILPPYKGAPPTPTLTDDDLAKLAKGEAVLKPSKDNESGGHGVSVQDVHADPATIWSRITSFANYPQWVDGCYECEPYEVTADHFKVRFVIGAMMVREEYFVDHLYKPDEGYMTWTLDYSRLSDLDDTVGFWRIQALPDKPGWTRVFYSVQVKLSGWVPGWIEDMLAKSGLTKATAWVKRESEKTAGTAAP
jgi:ribosome-associated toxin RatA of RatAB toxin-antitoxin module